MEVLLIFKFVLVLGVQHHNYFSDSFPISLDEIEYLSLCYAAGCGCLSILSVAPPSPPLVAITLFSMSESISAL